MLELSEVTVGDIVVVTGDDTYPKFFHVPGHKEGFVAKGLVGTVHRIYEPGASANLDRSDERDILVAFDEPKKWKAHFMPSELAAGQAAEPAYMGTSLLATEIELCSTTGGAPCDRVDSFMTPIADATLLSPEMPMRQAAELLNNNRITGAPVASAGRLVGVLTQFDFLYQEMRASRDGEGRIMIDAGKWDDSIKKSLAGTVAGAMSKRPVAVSPSSDMRQVAALMLSKRFNHVPVVEASGEVVGILTSQDVLRHVLGRLTEDGGVGGTGAGAQSY